MFYFGSLYHTFNEREVLFKTVWEIPCEMTRFVRTREGEQQLPQCKKTGVFVGRMGWNIALGFL